MWIPEKSQENVQYNYTDKSLILASMLPLVF